MDNDKKNIENLVFLLTVLFSVFLIAHYLIYNGMITFALADKIKYLDLTTIRLIRFIYCTLVFIIPIMSKFHFFKKKFSATYQISSSFILFILTFLLIYGYTKFTFYNVYIYPIVFVSHVFATILTIASFQKGLIVEDEFFKGVSNLPPDVPGFYFNLNTKEGVLSIHKPAENIFIDGGPGSGKSHYLIKFFIKQAMEREYAGVIYDYEGDPFSKGSPILSNIAYSALIKAKLDNPENKLRFAFINFTDMSRTNRVNVLSTRYYSPSNAKLFINTLANTLMKNLEPSWKEKSDFWSANAINFVSSVMYLLYKNHSKEGYNTLPHAISICLSPIDDIFNWLSKDDEIEKTMA
ncbi:MAG TPA: conjugal transfer protein TraG, partial [Tenuifilaceae bacterium]|nr:conjugal transfer protein TraG [Tenuifilaceae bacterium]